MPESPHIAPRQGEGSLKKIDLLVPDLPRHEQIRPWLERMDANRWYTNFGPLVRIFEDKIRRILRGPPDQPLAVAAVANATLGLELALSQSVLRPSSRVLVPSFTFPASACAIVRAGHVPVLADVDPDSLTLTPSIARNACEGTPIDAVMPVATLGLPVDADGWDAFARDTGLPVIVDAAGAIGNQNLGKNGIYVFSLHATKPFAVGEGGLVVSANTEDIGRIRQLSNFGFQGRGIVSAVGTNAKMSEYHAAVGLAALDLWENKTRKLRVLLNAYRDRCSGIRDVIRLLPYPDASVLASLTIRISPESRSESATLQSGLAASGIQTRRWYCPPLHRQPACQSMPRAGALAVTEELAATSLGLPFHAFLDRADVTNVVGSLERAIGR